MPWCHLVALDKVMEGHIDSTHRDPWHASESGSGRPRLSLALISRGPTCGVMALEQPFKLRSRLGCPLPRGDLHPPPGVGVRSVIEKDLRDLQVPVLYGLIQCGLFDFLFATMVDGGPASEEQSYGREMSHSGGPDKRRVAEGLIERIDQFDASVVKKHGQHVVTAVLGSLVQSGIAMSRGQFGRERRTAGEEMHEHGWSLPSRGKEQRLDSIGYKVRAGGKSLVDSSDRLGVFHPADGLDESLLQFGRGHA